MIDRFARPGLRLPLALCAAAFAMTLWACYPGDGPTVFESDVVVTLYRDDARFSEYKRYWMPDDVFHLSDPNDSVGDVLTREHDALILQTVADNMEAIGYTRYQAAVIDTTLLLQNVDVVLSISALATANVVVGETPGWWADYPGWGWGECCYDPSYPPTYAAGTFILGTVLIDMYDIQRITGDGAIPVPWSASMNGVLNSISDTAGRLTRAINQAYDQSDYLDGAGSGKGSP